MNLREALALTLLYASCHNEEILNEVRTLVPGLDEAMEVLDRMVEREVANRDRRDWSRQ